MQRMTVALVGVASLCVLIIDHLWRQGAIHLQPKNGWRGLSLFFTGREDAGCQHRLFFSQIEFCDNLIFHRRAALDNLWGAVA